MCAACLWCGGGKRGPWCHAEPRAGAGTLAARAGGTRRSRAAGWPEPAPPPRDIGRRVPCFGALGGLLLLAVVAVAAIQDVAAEARSSAPRLGVPDVGPRLTGEGRMPAQAAETAAKAFMLSRLRQRIDAVSMLILSAAYSSLILAPPMSRRPAARQPSRRSLGGRRSVGSGNAKERRHRRGSDARALALELGGAIAALDNDESWRQHQLAPRPMLSRWSSAIDPPLPPPPPLPLCALLLSVSALVMLIAGGMAKDRSRRRELLSVAFGARRALRPQ